MIFSTILLNAKSRSKIASSEYWGKPIPKKQIKRYLVQLEALIKKSVQLKFKPITVDEYKFISRECGDGIIIFVSDLDESDEDVVNKINRAAKALGKVLSSQSKKYIKENYETIIDRFVQSQFVIALIGQMGVGKTSLLHLLMGKPPPDEYIPTIAVNTAVIEGIKFANYELVLFDFAGHEGARDLWDISATDIVFLLTDSTLKNIIASKKILAEITKEYPETPLIVFANKQDTAQSLDPSAITKVLGSPSHPMVAIDSSYRTNLLGILVGALSEYFVLEVPNMPIEKLLSIEN